MCGIAGLVEAPGATPDTAVLRAMGDAIRHRGPDAGTTWVGAGPLGHVGLSHRRLSVLDHVGGAQPMSGSQCTVVFNGQIYNHLSLRHELVRDGFKFASDHSDTEVLLHGFRRWGTDLFAKLSGMFAFALVDEASRTLYLARDSIGKKPLYFATPSFFASAAPRVGFASELAALEAVPGARREVDVTSLARYFAFDFVPDPDCIYRGVTKIPPGSFVALPLADPVAWSSAAPRRFRALSFSRAHVPDNHDDRVVALRKAIAAAVETRLVADVPVGIFLSGGVDSSLIAALAAQHTSKLETFCIAFREPSFDESAHARKVAAHIGSTHHEAVLDERALLDTLPSIGAALSEPFADHSILPMTLLSRFTRERVTVALGGDGGDELFLGYPTFIPERARPRLLGRIGAFSPLAEAARRGASMLPVSHDDLALDFKVQRTLDGIFEADPLRRHQLFLTGASDARLRALFVPGARAQIVGDVLAPLDALAAEAREAGARDELDALTLFYMRTFMTAGVMVKVDRATMSASLEARAPLLDNDVVDLALALPSSEKLRGPPWRTTTKAILKDVAAGLLPNDIIHRKKKGFGFPVAKWLCGPLRPLVGDLLSRRAIIDDGLLDPDVVGTYVDEHLAKKRNRRKVLWCLLMYRLWRTRA